MKSLNVKERIILTDMALAEAIAIATCADCYHEDESLNWDASNGWPAFHALENNLTGRVELENDHHKAAYVEMTCPKCGQTSWSGDSEFFDVYKILIDDSGRYEIQCLED